MSLKSGRGIGFHIFEKVLSTWICTSKHTNSRPTTVFISNIRSSSILSPCTNSFVFYVCKLAVSSMYFEIFIPLGSDIIGHRENILKSFMVRTAELTCRKRIYRMVFLRIDSVFENLKLGATHPSSVHSRSCLKITDKINLYQGQHKP